MKQRSTKRALATSVLSTCACVTMLAGATFAWFTDEAKTGLNQIQAGKLDIGLYAEDGVTRVEGETLKWKIADGGLQENVLWEPGATYELQPVKVVNEGNLALKYKVIITGINGDAKLNEAIDWTINGEAIDEQQSLPVGETDEIKISGTMKETANNDYQNLSIEGVGITVVAKQDTVEKDTNGNQYDRDALYSDETLVTTAEELQKALDAATGGETIVLGADIVGDITVTQKPGVKLTIDGNGNTFNGVMTTFGNGRKATAALTIKNIDFVAANGADSCIVSPDRKENNAYSYSSNVTVENCTFTDPDGTVDCAAVRHRDGGDSNWKIINCTVDNTMHSLIQTNNVELDGLTIQGCDVYSKNGINLNQCTKVSIVDCNVNVKGYAVRYGVTGATVNGNFEIKDSTLKSANDDRDAVIIFRGTMTGSTLTITNTTLYGDPEISGNANVIRQ